MKKEYKINSYEDVEGFLYEIPRFTTENPFQKAKSFYQFLQYGEIEKKIIHIAGTNGKGSVCAYLSAILQKSGKKVGMFTSPHLVTMLERFQINRENTSEQKFVEAFKHIRKKLEEFREKSQLDYEPTFFEMLFFMGLEIFSKENVDILLLETGLGGKLDATNVTERPLVTIITEIGLDHMQYLGDTIANIAGEKAGIIKKNVPVVYTDYNVEKKAATAVIEEIADQKKSSCYCVHNSDILLENIRENSIDFSMKTRYYDYIRLSISTPAMYQVENAALAIRAIEALMTVLKQSPEEFFISARDIQEGIADMRWAARMEQILPGVYMDGGHNEDGVKAFLQTVESIRTHSDSHGENILLFSAVKDKAHEAMVTMICNSGLFEHIIITQIKDVRGIDADKLCEEFSITSGQDIQVVKEVEQAWKRCLALKGDNDRVYVTGSLYLAGLIKEIL